MTADEFEQDYCRSSGITIEFYREWFTTMTCKCDYEGCAGFAAIRLGFEKDQIELYGGSYINREVIDESDR